MKLYKLTDENKTTYNNTVWGEGVTHSASGKGQLCGDGWIHAYLDPLLAAFLNPLHANFKNPLLWVCEGEIGINEYGFKVGTKSLTTLMQIPLPVVTLEQCVEIGIRCALLVYTKPDFITWADNWLSGQNRTADAAYAAAYAADAAYAAAYAAHAARAADAALFSSLYTADAATYTADAATYAAYAAAYAAHAAAYAAHADAYAYAAHAAAYAAHADAHAAHADAHAAAYVLTIIHQVIQGAGKIT